MRNKLGLLIQALVITIALILPSEVFSQMRMSDSVLNFGLVSTELGKTLKVVVHNDNAIEQLDLKLSSSSEAFVVSSDLDGSTHLSVAPMSSAKINIKFLPVHNMDQKAVVILQASKFTGAMMLNCEGTGMYAGSYYSSTRNLEEEDLKAELKRIISKNYVNLGYTVARDKMYGELDNKNGKVTCVYTGRITTFNSRSGANSNNFNCEHTWPQSKFNSNEPERADIHHLYPTDAGANNRRSNYSFGVVSSASWTEGGSKLGGSLFEPRDEHKGDVARSMFYFTLRYTNYDNFLTSQEAILREWYKTDLPDSQETTRNEGIYKYQKNRNPFVDHPEFLDRISSLTSLSQKSKTQKLFFSDNNHSSFSPYLVQTQGNKPSARYDIVIYNCGNSKVEKISLKSRHGHVLTPTNIQQLDAGEGYLMKTSYSIDDPNFVMFDTIDVLVDGQILNSLAFHYGTSDAKKIEEETDDIYYNPATKTIDIENKDGRSVDISIIGTSGKITEHYKVHKGGDTINVNHLPPGIYYLRLVDRNQSKILKILVY